jgi:hypothetical protein
MLIINTIRKVCLETEVPFPEWQASVPTRTLVECTLTSRTSRLMIPHTSCLRCTLSPGVDSQRHAEASIVSNFIDWPGFTTTSLQENLKRRLAVRQCTLQALTALYLPPSYPSYRENASNHLEPIPLEPFPLSMSRMIKLLGTEEDHSVLCTIIRLIRKLVKVSRVSFQATG